MFLKDILKEQEGRVEEVRIDNKPREERLFVESWEVAEVEVDVPTLRPLINRVANEQNIPDYALEARPANAKSTDNFVWFDVFVTNRTTGDKIPIGVLTLESLGSNRTMLRVPPRSQWLKGDYTPTQLITMAYIEKDDDAIKLYEQYFMQFLESLDVVLRKYRLKVTFSKRFLRMFKEVAELYKVVKP